MATKWLLACSSVVWTKGQSSCQWDQLRQDDSFQNKLLMQKHEPFVSRNVHFTFCKFGFLRIT